MLEMGLKQWQRQKKSSPKNPLRVTFIGEAGTDNDTLRKEFLTGMFLLLCICCLFLILRKHFVLYKLIYSAA